MSSNGLINKAKSGKCRICQRVRRTQFLKAVGEVHHGFATGYIWECANAENCDMDAKAKIEFNHKHKPIIEQALKQGRFKEYSIINKRWTK